MRNLATFQVPELELFARCTLEDPPEDPLAKPVNGPCWRWDRFIGTGGYGMVSFDGETWRAHRLMASLCGMNIHGMVIDHLCRNRRCCNPDHLEAVTVRENAVRGIGGRSISSGRCCRCGSLNGYARARSTGRRSWECRPCNSARERAIRRAEVKAGISDPRNERLVDLERHIAVASVCECMVAYGRTEESNGKG